MKTSHRGFIVPLLLIIIALFLVGGGAYVYTQTKTTNSVIHTPAISSLSPSAGPTGTTVTINGSGFETTETFNGRSFTSAVGGMHAIYFKDNSVVIQFASDKTYKFVVPDKSTSGIYNVQVVNENGKSNLIPFTVTSSTQATSTTQTSTEAKQTPFISSLSPASGPGGVIVTIKGSGLTQSTNIYFNGEVVQNREKDNGSPSFRVPSSISNCPPGAYCGAGPQPIPAGAYSVQVANEGSKSNTVTFTVTSEKAVSIPVTATLTVGANGSNPSHSITIKSGDSIKYNWSRSNGTFGAGYTAEGCVDKNMDTTNTSTSAAPWGFFAGTANGSTDNFIVDNKWAGCTVLVTYSVFGEDGAKSDTVTVHVSR